MSEAQRKERLTCDEIDRARRVDLAALVSREVKLSRAGKWLVGLCPFHKERTPSFKIKDDRYICFGCGAKGDAIEWIEKTRNLSFIKAVRHLAGERTVPRLRLVSARKSPDHSATPEVTRARGIWREACEPTTVAAVKTHLCQRGITTFPESVRAIEHYNWFASVVLPVLVVAIQGPTGIVIGVQLTALTLDGTRKAFGKDSRRTEGVLAAGSARFAAAGEALGLAEGTEKAIAAQELTQIPCWASLGAARMHSVEIPDCVRELHIFADDDAPGREAAERTSKRYNDRRVIVRYPPEGCKDWDEVLVARRCT